MADVFITTNPNILAKEDSVKHVRNRYEPSKRATTALQISASGNNTVLTPTSGKAIRLHWVGLVSSENNGSEVLAIVKFGTTGNAIYRWYLGTPGLFSHWETIDGGTNQPLIVNLSAAQNVQVNLTYEEVTP